MSAFIKLWKDMRAGAAFECCVRPHVPRLHRLAWRLTGSEADADDLLQETLLRAYPKRAEVVELEAPGPWLARVLHNAWIDRWRRKGVMRKTEALDDMDVEASGSFVSDEPLLVAVETAALDVALLKLPEHHREVILMHDGEGYTLQEVSQILEVPLGTLKSRLHRAREALRAQLCDKAHFQYGTTPSRATG